MNNRKPGIVVMITINDTDELRKGKLEMLNGCLRTVGCRLTKKRCRILLQQCMTNITNPTGSPIGTTFDHSAAACFAKDCSAVTAVKLIKYFKMNDY